MTKAKNIDICIESEQLVNQTTSERIQVPVFDDRAGMDHTILSNACHLDGATFKCHGTRKFGWSKGASISQARRIEIYTTKITKNLILYI